MNRQIIKDYLPILSLCNGLIIAYLLSDLWILLYVALGISFVSILFPVLAFYIGFGAKSFVKFISMIVFTIVASFFYIILITPIGWLKRIAEKQNPFKMNESLSYFIETNKTFSKESFERMG